jgi:hypothetical protein
MQCTFSGEWCEEAAVYSGSFNAKRNPRNPRTNQKDEVTLIELFGREACK